MRFLTSLLFTVAASVVPIDLGIVFGPGSNNIPVLKLPYASYKAYSYDVTDDYYVFKNIRFAAPPTGERRWKKPEPPLIELGVPDGKTGYQCNQAAPPFINFAYPLLQSLEPASEDCLFLDIQVPGKAVRGEAKNLPVLFWIFGGGYILGSKSFFLYDGAPFLKSGENNFIWVAPNYRLGAFGFLNGPTMEKSGTPNVAFHDQRAALQWVQDYIHLLNGEKNTVAAMGESAGAGSIMHHLTAEGGTVNPMFHRAIMSSPAYEPEWLPNVMEDQYKLFEKEAGCAGQGVACLRTKDTGTLQRANLKTIGAAQYGTFGFGPGVDNSYVQDLPSIEMTNGRYWKDVSVLIGHMSNEGFLFADPTVITNDQMDALMVKNYPTASVDSLSQLKSLYPAPGLFKKYKTNFQRLAENIADYVVTCNVNAPSGSPDKSSRWSIKWRNANDPHPVQARALATAYAGKAWLYSFGITPGIHTLDLLFMFWRTDLNLYDILQIDIDINFITQKNYATGFQSYLSSFARCGDPNKYRQKNWFSPTIEFPQASVGDTVKVLDVTNFGFKISDDPDTSRDRCDFWHGGAWKGV